MRLTDKQIVIKIAEFCGWEHHPEQGEVACWCRPGHRLPGNRDFISEMGLPSYLDNLNAMHEAEKELSNMQGIKYRLLLSANSDENPKEFLTVEAAMCHATARQRAIAFVRIITS